MQEASSGDEEEDEDEEGQKVSKKSKKAVETIKVTDKMIKEWKAAMKKEPSARLFREVTQAFKAAVATTKGEGGGQCRYKVADSSGKTTCLIWAADMCIQTMMLLVSILYFFVCLGSVGLNPFFQSCNFSSPFSYWEPFQFSYHPSGAMNFFF